MPLASLSQVVVHLLGRITRRDEERGASLVEYALLVALIALACVGAVVTFGGSVNTQLSSSANSI